VLNGASSTWRRSAAATSVWRVGRRSQRGRRCSDTARSFTVDAQRRTQRRQFPASCAARRLIDVERTCVTGATNIASCRSCARRRPPGSARCVTGCSRVPAPPRGITPSYTPPSSRCPIAFSLSPFRLTLTTKCFPALNWTPARRSRASYVRSCRHLAPTSRVIWNCFTESGCRELTARSRQHCSTMCQQFHRH